MQDESFNSIKRHCQNILDIVCGIENGNSEQNFDRLIVLKELSGCVTSYNQLGKTLQTLIDQLNVVESNEEQIRVLPLVPKEEENWESSSDVGLNADYEQMISESISNTFDDIMTLENLLKVTHVSIDNNADIKTENCETEVGDNGEQDQAINNNNNNNEVKELGDGDQMNQDSPSENYDTISIDLQLDTDKLMNQLLTIQNEEKITTNNVLSDLEEEDVAMEPNRKRKPETSLGADCELKSISSKQSRQRDEPDSVPSDVTLSNVEQALMASDDATDIEWLIEEEQLSEINFIECSIENNDRYENEEHRVIGVTIEISSDSEDGTQLIPIRNTNREIHCKDPFYQTVCLLCGENEPFMPAHYMKNHPNHEVLVARPSPELAERLRLQTEKFEIFKKGKIRGICYFCDENKTMQRASWSEHILTHTGERLYACDGCNSSFDLKASHDDKECNSEPANIFLFNSTDDSLVGFMCRECNYLQIQLKRMIDHLKNEHGFECPTEKWHYDKHTLVPDVHNNTQSDSAAINSSMESISPSPTKRRSVSFISLNGEDGGHQLSISICNTNPDIHYKNQLACVLCGVEDSNLAYHYTKFHAKREMFIARPSPHMADKLRSQAEKFAVNGKKVTGLCYFCEEIQILPRLAWRQHILKHTGEKIFSCNGCGNEVNYKNQHTLIQNMCNGKLIDIYEANSSDGSYAGFMCNECNYVQIKLERMIKHLTNEHGYDSPAEHQHYEKLTLLPSNRTIK